MVGQRVVDDGLDFLEFLGIGGLAALCVQVFEQVHVRKGVVLVGNGVARRRGLFLGSGLGEGGVDDLGLGARFGPEFAGGSDFVLGVERPGGRESVFFAELTLDFAGFAGDFAGLDGEFFLLVRAGELDFPVFFRPDAGQGDDAAQEGNGMDAGHHDKAGHIKEDEEDAGADWAEGIMEKLSEPMAEPAALAGDAHGAAPVG
jgi:hypothetical protein